ncbi:MAG: adenosylcobinamide-GDP ribazoletransferase [Oscillospiraceae bacterium]|jgi:adenosylcobinamide-GDP ribazoletransferase|nr:adenosylcobinamide-GDP ribazoletransferase [Oscillospiraceae bacterium]
MNAIKREVNIPKHLKPIVIAFGMYSRIPMPSVEWGADSMAYALAGFPLVGVVIGAALWVWMRICSRLGVGALLQSAGMMLIHIAIAGGIHLDGFCDVSDALASHQPAARKLEIMKDSRVGAFAVISLCLYMLTEFAVLSEMAFTPDQVMTIAAVPALSRALTGFAAVTFKNARGDGVLAAFVSSANTNAVRAACAAWFAVSVALMIIARPSAGVVVTIASLASFVYYRYMAYKQFGGITGDLSGWFLQVCEWVCLVAVAASQWI